MKKFSHVIVIFDNKYFALSFFKTKKRKIKKEEYHKYLYSKAFNFGLFYIGYSGKNEYNKFTIDFSSYLGNLRFIRRIK